MTAAAIAIATSLRRSSSSPRNHVVHSPGESLRSHRWQCHLGPLAQSRRRWRPDDLVVVLASTELPRGDPARELTLDRSGLVAGRASESLDVLDAVCADRTRLVHAFLGGLPPSSRLGRFGP